jgi:hypothetical protein
MTDLPLLLPAPVTQISGITEQTQTVSIVEIIALNVPMLPPVKLVIPDITSPVLLVLNALQNSQPVLIFLPEQLVKVMTDQLRPPLALVTLVFTMITQMLTV